jgi:hypothetical protein
VAGKNQHYIPQFLLRAFRIGPGKVARVYKFQAEGVFPLPTKQVAAEDWFYSHLSADGGKTLDDLITDHEGGQLTADFGALYKAPCGPVDASLAARTIGHLFGRVDHVRGVARSGVELLAHQIEFLFGGEEQLRYIFGTDGPLPGERFREAFSGALAGDTVLGSLGLPGPVLERLAYSMLRENMSAGISDINRHALSLAETFRANASSVARNAQVKSLTTTLLPEARIEVLEAFDWRIEDVAAPTFILPDFVALARSASGEAGTLLTFDKDELAGVLMPLSPTRMLIGQREVSPAQLERFNEDAVPHCLAFFVSAFTDDAIGALRSVIGQRVLEPIHQALAEAASEFRRQVESPKSSATLPPADWDVELPASFGLEIHGYDDAARDAVGSVLMQLVAWARSRFDVSGLIRFVIAEDYDQALATIDRGALATGEPVTASQDGMSVAFNVPIERDGLTGYAVVLRSGIPAMLLGPDDEHYAAAAAIVLSQLARLGADALVAKVFVGGAAAGDVWDRALLPRSVNVWRSYFLGGYQCLFGERLQAEYRENLLGHLEGMTGRLVAARRAFRHDGDVDALLDTVIPDAFDAVTLAALAAAAVGGDPDQGSVESFRAALEAHGLLKWFDLLTSDLAAIWREGEPYPAQEAFLVINRHVQRLLVPGTIFFWESDEGPRVEVPYGLDPDWLLAQSTGNLPVSQ